MELHGFCPLSKIISPTNTIEISSSDSGSCPGVTHFPSSRVSALSEAEMIAEAPSGSSALVLSSCTHNSALSTTQSAAAVTAFS